MICILEICTAVGVQLKHLALCGGKNDAQLIEAVEYLVNLRALEKLVDDLETLLFCKCLVTFHNRCVCVVFYPCFAVIYLAVEARSGVSLLTFLLLTLSFFLIFPSYIADRLFRLLWLLKSDRQRSGARFYSRNTT